MIKFTEIHLLNTMPFQSKVEHNNEGKTIPRREHLHSNTLLQIKFLLCNLKTLFSEFSILLEIANLAKLFKCKIDFWLLNYFIIGASFVILL